MSIQHLIILVKTSEVLLEHSYNYDKLLRLLDKLDKPEKQEKLILKIFEKYTEKVISDRKRLARGELLKFAIIKLGNKNLEEKKLSVLESFKKCQTKDYIKRIKNPNYIPRFEESSKVIYLYKELPKLFIPALKPQILEYRQMRVYIYHI
jgi:hypothetical protein